MPPTNVQALHRSASTPPTKSMPSTSSRSQAIHRSFASAPPRRPTDLTFAVDVVRRLRAQCEFLIVSLHWGFGSGEALAEYQGPLGAALIDAGADVIHGHHPHAVHAIGAHRGKPILFGMGTFMAQQFFLNSGPAAQALRAGMSPDGYVALVDVEADNRLSVRVVPTTLDDDHLPTLASGTAFDRIAERLVR